MKNPWKTLTSQQIYNNPWIKVREDQVKTPAGTDGIYGIVEFRNLAIGVIPIDEEGHTYLVGQYRYPLNEYSWEIPEGGSPVNENPLDGAKRELKEETGLIADEWAFLCELRTSNSVTNEKGLIYLARTLTGGESQPEETEELQIKKLPLSKAVEMVMNGEITDSLSMIGLLKADKLIRENQLELIFNSDT